MSEFNPFSVPDETAEYVAEEPVESSEGGSKKNLVLVGALALAAVGAGAFMFLGGGEDEVEEFVPAATAPRAAAPAPSASPATTLPVSSQVTLGRNPFRALYVEPAAAAAAPAGGGTTTPTTTGTTTPIVVVDSGPAPTNGGSTYAPPPGQPAPAPAAATVSTVQLKSVAAAKDGTNPTGTFVYDGKTVTGAPGDVMAGKLLVISLQQDHTGGWFANLQLGDGSPFEVHENQKVVVQ